MKISECLAKRIDEEIERLQKIRDKKKQSHQTIEKMFDMIMSFNDDMTLEVIPDRYGEEDDYETRYRITLNRHGDYLYIICADWRGLTQDWKDERGHGTEVSIHVYEGEEHVKAWCSYLLIEGDVILLDEDDSISSLLIEGDVILLDEDDSISSDRKFILGDAIRSRTPNADQLEAFINQCLINGKLESEV